MQQFLSFSNSLRMPWGFERRNEASRSDNNGMQMLQKCLAGGALAVDRMLFSKMVTERIENNDNIEVVNEEVTCIPKEGITVVATGPLTSETLSKHLKDFWRGIPLFFDAKRQPLCYL